MTKNYDLIKAKFLDFLADPNRSQTQGEFAKENDVNPATLSDWKKDREFKDKFIERLDRLLIDDLPKIYQTMKNKALAGDVSWARMYVQQINLLRNYKDDIQKQENLEKLIIIVGSEEEAEGLEKKG